MLQNVRIQNYRRLKDTEIGPLGRINLVTGKNGAGKTSLLEALFLLSGAGNPDLLVSVNVNRGLVFDTTVRPTGLVSAPSFESIALEYFPTFDFNQPIEITGTIEQARQVKVLINVEHATTEGSQLPAQGTQPATAATGDREIVLRYTDPEGQIGDGRLRVTAEGIRTLPPERDPPYKGTMVRAHGGHPAEDAELLAKLRNKQVPDFITKALQCVDPRVKSVTVGEGPLPSVICADLGFSELVPLPVLGEGITRIARIMLAIAYAPEGLMLVDEIENGLHHSVVKNVWHAVDEAAKSFNTQIVATTQSFECVRAAHKVIGAEDLRLHRLDVKDDGVRAVTYDRESLDTTIEMNFEVR